VPCKEKNVLKGAGEFLVVGIVLGLIAFLVWGISSSVKKTAANHCVLEKPLCVVEGEMIHPGLWEKPRYKIWYQGKRKVTSDDCTKSMYVTKSEYEWVMYGRENQPKNDD
jgi:hypothetical protein